MGRKLQGKWQDDYGGEHVYAVTPRRRGYGTSVDYLMAKLKRDRPDICERWLKGEFRSMRAAARAAGWVVDKTPADHVRHWWRRLSVEEMDAFLCEVLACTATELDEFLCRERESDNGETLPPPPAVPGTP